MFVGKAILKEIIAIRNLKYVNRICNLETMVISNANKKTIVSASLKHVSE
ncbi:hypothetical protein DB44_AL00210 [Candidatus Protochlamydia amoebophila]|uniref:Uncharacterized protein n=1 Tax=Candidatus Protochlamydia amoebophila TaxID=362787 RepID=A0A0C1K4T7_9BACT|nr:hypothetical protein DB44_AL00210 [Candidatus Protochlamydia amoebophila]